MTDKEDRFCRANFDYMDYKEQEPTDSLIQYFYTQRVDEMLPFTLVTGSYSVVHIVTTRENTELGITHTGSIVLM